MRTENDSIGSFFIPDNSLYGINTARSLSNFPSFSESLDFYLSKSYFYIKKAAFNANLKLNYIPLNIASYIEKSIEFFMELDSFDDYIVVNPLSGGAGTSINMNFNEVIANKALLFANRPLGDYNFIHPINHINLHQSTNDTFPSALKIAVLFYLKDLENEIISLQNNLQIKETEFSHIVKLGRTELQDALPMTVGQQFSAYSETIARDRWRIFKARERIKTINFGGNAIGTGFNVPKKFIFLANSILRDITNLNITRSENLVDATQNLDSIVEVSGLIKTLAVNLMKISEDIRFLSSGPQGGIGEFVLEPLQEGSSAMPGKVNPVIPEFITQISLLVISNDNAISHAVSLGNLEINQFLPLISYLILKNLKLMLIAVKQFSDKLIKNITINKSKIKSNLDNSIAIITYLSHYLGHDKAAEIYNLYKNSDKSIKEIIINNNYLSHDKYDELLSHHKIMSLGY